MAGRRTTSNISFPDPSNSSHLFTPRTQYCLVCLIFQLRPPFLLVDLAWGAENSLVFAEYSLASFGSSPSPSRTIFSSVHLLAFVCLTGVLLLHGLHIPAGIRLQNMLGFGILLIVIGTGFIALTGNLREGVPRPGNFDSWERIWAGSTTGGSALCTCPYNVRSYFFKQFSPTIDILDHILLHWLQQCQLLPFRSPQLCSNASDSRSTFHRCRRRFLPPLQCRILCCSE